MNQISEIADDEYCVDLFRRYGALLLCPVPLCESPTRQLPLLVPAAFRATLVIWSATCELLLYRFRSKLDPEPEVIATFVWLCEYSVRESRASIGIRIKIEYVPFKTVELDNCRCLVSAAPDGLFSTAYSELMPFAAL